MDSIGDVYNEIGVTRESTVEEIKETFEKMDIGDRKWFSAYLEIVLDPIKRSFYDEIDELAQSLSKGRKKKDQITTLSCEDKLFNAISKTIDSIKSDPVGRVSWLLRKRVLYLLVDVNHELTSENLAKEIILRSLMIAKMNPPEATLDVNILWDCKKLSLLLIHRNVKRLYYTQDIVAACNQLTDCRYKVPNDVKVTADLVRKLVFCLIPDTEGGDFRSSVIKGAIFPSMGYTNEEIRLYEKNPTEYAHLKLGEFFHYGFRKGEKKQGKRFRSRFRRAIRRWICDEHQFMDTCKFCLEILERPTEGNEADKERALQLIAIAFDSSYSLFPTRNEDDIVNHVAYKMLTNHLPNLTKAKSTFLRARACSVMDAFRICQWGMSYGQTRHLYQNLASEPELCVKLEVLMLHNLRFDFSLESHKERQALIKVLFETIKPLRSSYGWELVKFLVKLDWIEEFDRLTVEDTFGEIATKLESIIKELIENLRTTDHEKEIDKTTEELKNVLGIWKYICNQCKLDRSQSTDDLFLHLAQLPSEKRKRDFNISLQGS